MLRFAVGESVRLIGLVADIHKGKIGRIVSGVLDLHGMKRFNKYEVFVPPIDRRVLYEFQLEAVELDLDFENLPNSNL